MCVLQSLQLGQPKAEHTKYYLYWVPAQYVRAIKNTIMGTFDFWPAPFFFIFLFFFEQVYFPRNQFFIEWSHPLCE